MPLRDSFKDSPITRAFSIALVAVALIGAQIAGVGHRIEHAPGSDAHRAQWLALLQHGQDCDDHSHTDHARHNHDSDHAPEHDCAAYDAATLGDGPPIARSESSSATSPHPVASVAIEAVNDKSPQLPFHSRAPPRV